MTERKPTLEELYDQYQTKFINMAPVMQLMGISEKELYDILRRAIAKGKPLEMSEQKEL